MPSAEASLTPRERQVVGLLTDPSIASKAEAARVLDLDRSTIGKHAAKRHVERAIEARLERLSDKASGELGKLRRVQAKALEALEQMVEEPLSPELALLLVAKLGEATLTQLKIQELTPQPLVRPETAKDRERRRTTRAMRAALWIGSGRRLLGWPSAKVERTSPPTESTSTVDTVG